MGILDLLIIMTFLLRNSFPKSGTHLLSQVLMNQKSLETMEDLLPWRLQLVKENKY